MKRIYALSIPLLLAATLTGCTQGMIANTTMQGETGNGVKMAAGDIQIESVTIVAGEDGSGVGAISAVLVNGSDQADVLQSISVGGREATLTPAPVPVGPGESVAIASQSQVRAQADLDAVAGDFVEVSFEFGVNGAATHEVLVVPPVGYYEPFAPLGPEPIQPPQVEPTPSPAAGAGQDAAARP